MSPTSENQTNDSKPETSHEKQNGLGNKQEDGTVRELYASGHEHAPDTLSDDEDNSIDGGVTAVDSEQTTTEISPEDLTVEQWLDKLATSEELAAERLDGQQRSLADFQNYKRRTTREMQLVRQNAAATLLTKFFPIMDDLVLALDSLPTTGDGAAWSGGVAMVHRKLMSVLEGENVAIIEAEPGQEFDPHFHEAIAHEEHADYDTDLIIAVVRPGYQLDERVLRPAQVRVAK